MLLYTGRPRFSGALRYPSRALLPGGDGKAFGLKKPYRGGTLLVDLSGSMRLNLDQVRRFVIRSPAATVAVYASTEDLQGGILAVISKRGRVIPDDSEVREVLSSGNVVDGPALLWLSQQAHPRLWLSDGAVTGVGDRSTSKLQRQCEEISSAHQIRRITRLDEVKDATVYR